MKAIVKTSTNFKNCNGKRLPIKKCHGKFITCIIPQYGYDSDGNPQGDMITADFALNEIVGLYN